MPRCSHAGGRARRGVSSGHRAARRPGRALAPRSRSGVEPRRSRLLPPGGESRRRRASLRLPRTYTVRAANEGGPLPLSRALTDSSDRRDKSAMLSLLVPVHRAAGRARSWARCSSPGPLPLARLDGGRAYRFLKEIPVLEAAGIVVRVPDWWNAGGRGARGDRLGRDQAARRPRRRRDARLLGRRHARRDSGSTPASCAPS